VKLLIIRPQPGADATAHRLRAAGYEPILMPLFSIEVLPMQRRSADGYDALLLTSGNAARAAGEFLTNNPATPICRGQCHRQRAVRIVFARYQNGV
jgi:uroporphyrinogen-III synthase